MTRSRDYGEVERRPRLRSYPALGCLLLLVICAPNAIGNTSPPSPCGPRAQPAAVVQLVFGLNVGDERGVTETAFSRFLDEQVSPRFPQGFTVVDGQGRWQVANGGQIVEASKVITLVTADHPAQRARLEAIRRAYVRKFRQESVLLLAQSGCVSF